MTYINSNIHYYGWYRVQQAIDTIDTNIKIINFVDIYFLNYNVEVIEEPWIGIIHHTSCSFSTNNIISLFKNNVFLNSLKYCKHLISLSYYNKQNITFEINSIYTNIPVLVLKHPQPPNPSNRLFNLKLFEESLNVFNIGGWLRNPYTIYHCDIKYNDILLNKNKLKGNAMEQYFPNDGFDLSTIVNKIVLNKGEIEKYTANIDNIFQYSHPSNSSNYYIKYLIEYIKYLINGYEKKNEKYSDIDILNKLISNHNSVKLVSYMSNADYLNMLVSSIVFCDYIDCSASNTILECISTATPIILNRHPAILEYLGYNYALYFDNIYDASTNTYVLTSEQVQLAHTQLLEIRKNSDIELSNFIHSIKLLCEKISGLDNKRKNKYFFFLK